MSHHGNDDGEVDGVDATVVLSALIRGDHAGALFLFRKMGLRFEHPCHEGIVSFANSGPSRTFCGHVAQRRSFINREGGQPWATEFHASVQRQFLTGVVG